MKPIRHCLSATGLILLCGWAGAQQPAATPISFTIEAQPIEDALNQFAQQTGLQLLLPAGEAEGIRAPRIEGTYTPRIALAKLLGDSGLRYEFVNERTVSIHSSKGEKGQSEAAESTGHMRTSEAETTGSLSLSPGESSTGVLSPQNRIVLAQAEQSDSSSEEVSSADSQKENELAEVLITGTHIRGIAPESSPLKIYKREDIEKTGVATVEQFMRLLPENFSSTDSSTIDHSVTASSGNAQRPTSASSGQAGVNLHGLGYTTTLVLVNGHRLSPGGGNADFTDISMIPLSAVERIEVLTDGASALYGADAIAGVVNFVLRKNFEGAETVLRQSGATRGGMDSTRISQLLGTSWGNGNALLTYEYSDEDGLRASQRDFVPDGDSKSLNLLPVLERHSVFVAGQQNLGKFKISFDGLYSDKAYESDSDQRPSYYLQGRSSGRTKQYGGVFGIEREMFGDWAVQLANSYSKFEDNTSTIDLETGEEAFAPYATTSSNWQTDFHANGSLPRILGILPKMAVGGSFRKEEASTGFARSLLGPNETMEREVKSAFAELYLPLIESDANRRFLNRLELSLAGRYDNYQDVGSSTNPKFGLLWSPASGLNFRATYAESYRVARLDQLVPLISYTLSNSPDTTAEDGITATLVNVSQDGTVGPETSESFSAGIDYRPPSLSGLSITATYFNTQFTDRIGKPPLTLGTFSIYSQPELAPLIDKTPDSAEIQAILASSAPILFLPAACIPDRTTLACAATIEATFDFRLRNIAATEQSGVDASISYAFDTSVGNVSVNLAGSYLFENASQTIAGNPWIDNINTIANPTDLNLRGMFSWSRGGFASSLSVNYKDAYQNNLLDPAERVDSWTTADLQVSYDTGTTVQSSFLQNLRTALTVQNLTDEDPPLVRSDFASSDLDVGYDAANASPLGRVIALLVSKRW